MIFMTLGRFSGHSRTATRCRGGELEDDSQRVWFPVGRNGWRSHSRRRILDRLQQREELGNLVEAGFGGGSVERLAKTMERYEGFAARLGWWI